MMWIFAIPFALLALVMSNAVVQQQMPGEAGTARRLAAGSMGLVGTIALYAACLGFTGYVGAFELGLARGTTPSFSSLCRPAALGLSACAGLVLAAWVLGCRQRTLVRIGCYWLAYAPLTVLAFIAMYRTLGLPLSA
jgi:hypothetical protein